MKRFICFFKFKTFHIMLLREKLLQQQEDQAVFWVFFSSFFFFSVSSSRNIQTRIELVEEHQCITIYRFFWWCSLWLQTSPRLSLLLAPPGFYFSFKPNSPQYKLKLCLAIHFYICKIYEIAPWARVWYLDL